MARRWLIALALVFAALCAASQPAKGPVVVLGGGDGTALWLPGETNVAGEAVASAVHRRFIESWKAFFGARPTVSDPLLIPRSDDLPEGVFEALWADASTALDPEARPAALSALRSAVLGDPTPLVEGLARHASSRRLGDEMVQEALLYLFLAEVAADPALLPQALPPGPGGARLKRALERAGMPYPAFLQRYAAWVFSKTVEARLVDRTPGALPAVWALSEDLPPGGWSSWSFDVPDPASAVDLAAAGDARGLRLLTFLTDASGRVLQAGVGTPAEEGSLPLVAGAHRLWVVLWNAGRSHAGGGLALTLWADQTPPFRLREGTIGGGALDLVVEERAGILDYALLDRPYSKTPVESSALPPFPSRGAGVNRYRVALLPGFSVSEDLYLQCRTLSGGTYTSPVLLKERPRP